MSATSISSQNCISSPTSVSSQSFSDSDQIYTSDSSASPPNDRPPYRSGDQLQPRKINIRVTPKSTNDIRNRIRINIPVSKHIENSISPNSNSFSINNSSSPNSSSASPNFNHSSNPNYNSSNPNYDLPSSNQYVCIPPSTNPHFTLNSNSLPGTSNSVSIIPSNSIQKGRILGSGTYGIVYSGIITKLRKPIAIKINQVQESVDFLGTVRELDSLSDLTHPNVLPLLGICSSSDFGLPDHRNRRLKLTPGRKWDTIYYIYEKGGMNGD